MVAVVTNVGALQKEWNPADLILSEEDAQSREAVEETGQDPLDGGNRTVAAHRAETSYLFDQIVGEFLHDLVRFFRIFEKRSFAFAGALQIDVHADRHLQLQRA